MILIVGGTSSLGSLLVKALVERGRAVRVLTRSPERVDALRSVGVEVVIGDARSQQTLRTAVAGCTTVVSAMHGFLGGRGRGPEAIDRDANVALIRASVEAGVERFILLSAYGAAPRHPMSLQRMKFAAEQALINSELGWTIVRPMPFLETWRRLMGEHIADRHTVLVLGRGTNPIAFVSVDTVCRVVEQLILHDSQRNEIVDVVGTTTVTFNQIADELATDAGFPVAVRRIPMTALRVVSVLAKPVSPAFARGARAAVVMNSTDMTATASLNVL